MTMFGQPDLLTAVLSSQFQFQTTYQDSCTDHATFTQFIPEKVCEKTEAIQRLRLLSQNGARLGLGPAMTWKSSDTMVFFFVVKSVGKDKSAKPYGRFLQSKPTLFGLFFIAPIP